MIDDWESSNNGLTDLKRKTGQAPRKLVNANQSGRNNINNLNVGSKSDKIAKDTINAPKSRNSKKIQALSSQTDQQFPKETGAT